MQKVEAVRKKDAVWVQQGSRKSQTEWDGRSNLSCGALLRREREKRGISQEKLSRGLLSRASLKRLEEGEIGWTKLTGDALLQRMGIAVDYFEETASGEELDRWRLREDICLLILSEPVKAWEKLVEYREKYRYREKMEEQFLKKMELVLCLLERKTQGEEISSIMERILKKWQKKSVKEDGIVRTSREEGGRRSCTSETGAGSSRGNDTRWLEEWDWETLAFSIRIGGGIAICHGTGSLR